jgi:hypothetical protein
MLSGASTGMFFFLGWAAALCHTVARINVEIRICRAFIGAPCELHMLINLLLIAF